MLHCVAVRAICCNLALFPSYYLCCAISLKRLLLRVAGADRKQRIGSDDAFSFGCRNLKLLATDERNADENLACVEVRERQEENQADLQDPLGTLRIVPSGSNAIESLYGRNTKRGLASGNTRFERKDSVPIDWTRRQWTRPQAKHHWKPASGC